eukprot:4102579-Pyramimonas_sp.AAC.1
MSPQASHLKAQTASRNSFFAPDLLRHRAGVTLVGWPKFTCRLRIRVWPLGRLPATARASPSPRGRARARGSPPSRPPTPAGSTAGPSSSGSPSRGGPP